MILKLKFDKNGNFMQYQGDVTVIYTSQFINQVDDDHILTDVRFEADGKYYHQPIYAPTEKWVDFDTDLCDNFSTLELKEKKMTNKEKLKKQIEEMEAKLQEMRDELESSDKFEMKGGDWLVSVRGAVVESPAVEWDEHYQADRINFGMSRETEQQAQELRDFLRKTLIIKNYADQHNGDWKPDWSDGSQLKHHVYYQHKDGAWLVSDSWNAETRGVVYMKQEVAESLCEKLNSGEIKL